MEEHGFNLLQAVYHRSLNFSKFSSLDIVLKSSCVGSAFVRPYWPRYLQATRSKVVTTVIGSNYSDVACRLKCGHPSLMTVPGDLLDSFSDSHKQVPNIEAIFRFDKNKANISTFICSYLLCMEFSRVDIFVHYCGRGI